MSATETDLNNKVAIVTGAGSGLGLASASALAEEGAHLVITELPDRFDRAEDAARALNDCDLSASAAELDVTDIESIRRCVDFSSSLAGHIDILVNNAGIAIRGDAFELTEENWDAVLDVNLKGVFFMSQAVGRVMRDQQPHGGSIVNMASIMGLVGYYQRASYCSSKAGVINLTRVLAAEWSDVGIRVNAVCPTFVDTPLTRPLFDSMPDFSADVMRRTPMGRLATPEEVAAAVVYLCSPGAAMVQGHALTVDGGWTAM